MTNEAMNAFFDEQIAAEREIVASVQSATTYLRNDALKGILLGIARDSQKHAALYQAAARLLTATPPRLVPEAVRQQRRLVEDDIRREAVLIQRINATLPSIADERVTLLLKVILDDEERHHKLLNAILDDIVDADKDEDWWHYLQWL